MTGVSVSQLLYIQHFCHLVENLGVIVITVELVSVDTISQNCNRQTGVGVGGEGDTGLIVQNMGQSYGQRIISAVHHILLLGILTGLGTVDALLVCSTQLLQFVSGQNQFIILLALSLQTEQSLDISKSFLEPFLLWLIK